MTAFTALIPRCILFNSLMVNHFSPSSHPCSKRQGTRLPWYTHINGNLSPIFLAADLTSFSLIPKTLFITPRKLLCETKLLESEFIFLIAYLLTTA